MQAGGYFIFLATQSDLRFLRPSRDPQPVHSNKTTPPNHHLQHRMLLRHLSTAYLRTRRRRHALQHGHVTDSNTRA